MRPLILVLFLMSGCHFLLEAAPPAIQKCMDRVTARYAPLKDHPDLQTERKFQADLARCEFPAMARPTAICLGAANFDYTRLARALRDHKITPAEYIERVRDRSSKRARCADDAKWSRAYAAGDADGDLVPDRFDRCPGTPELTATDSFGCPLTGAQQPSGPSPEDVDRVFKLRVPLGNPKCANAAIPTVPAVIAFESVGFPTVSPPKLRSVFRTIANQPQDCPWVYQVQVEEIIPPRLDDPSTPSPRPPERISLVLKPRDATNASDPAAGVLVFESVHEKLPFLFHQGARAKARAVNGNGTASAWSGKVKIERR
jgi:hypothetical protein